MKTLYRNCKIVSCGNIDEGMLIAEDGFISEILEPSDYLPQADKIIDLQGNYLAAAFIDGHIHGSGGHGTDIADYHELLAMSTLLKEQGLGGFLPTIYPAKPEAMINTLKKLVPAFGKETGAKILGFHLEGPFISPEKPGVMKKEDIGPIDIDIMDKLYEAAEGKVAALTVAPELENFDKLADFCREKNILMQAGHTNATYEQMLAAAPKGVRHITHLFNAMRGLNHREPGAAGAALISDAFSCEVIADGKHLHPAILLMVKKLKDPEQIVLVSDSLNPTGLKEGLANGEKVEMADGLFRRKEDSVIAGSALTMLKGVKNLIEWGYPAGQAFMTANENPAKLHKLNFGKIQKGAEAKLIALDRNFNLTKVYF